MDEHSYSFVLTRGSVCRAFHGIAPRELVLSLLAGISPETAWEGCLVYEGASPLESGTACVGISGPGADVVQLRLVEALEQRDVDVVAVYEGGPEPTTPIARARQGRWVEPGR